MSLACARPLALLALLALPAGCGAQELPAPPRPCPDAPTSAAFQPPVVAPPAATEGTVTRLTARDQVPLTGPRVDAKPGDCSSPMTLGSLRKWRAMWW